MFPGLIWKVQVPNRKDDTNPMLQLWASNYLHCEVMGDVACHYTYLYKHPILFTSRQIFSPHLIEQIQFCQYVSCVPSFLLTLCLLVPSFSVQLLNYPIYINRSGHLTQTGMHLIMSDNSRSCFWLMCQSGRPWIILLRACGFCSLRCGVHWNAEKNKKVVFR